ncbi:D-alanyl-D-alanine carboxypeptidase [Bacillus sp. V3B]|uniref:D-alanyl-D-alanine carboxypeptidase family protein n=1 Tax=Bacillus sp. V3B TaxID=2804915 RepID=UPI00210CF6D8|nr:D-alanyl-D-alanine carboxypeptidase family protein [Bacillus sp. V3B]MCQ6273829.1 D-alanyl-D-alanine carboxypeptidase [Bacillus sp. V3B]
MKYIRLLIVFIVITSTILLYFPFKTEASGYASASSAVLMEQQSGRVLYEKKAHQVRRIASITKIMTAILAIESGKLNDTVKVSENAVRAAGSSIYLKPGEKIKLEDLVYGLMLRSGNDSAVAIAEHVGGSLDGFVYLMNQKAEGIGMKNTHFANPHGLDDHEDHFSTAYDMALLTRYAMTNDTYKLIAGTKVHRAPNPTENWDRVWKNKNRLLTELYDYTTGGKTGYTKRAKRTLVTTATKDNLDLIAVTLNGPDDWNDHINMYEYGFKNYKLVNVLQEGTIKEVNEPFYKKRVYLKHDILYPIASNERDLFKVEFKLQEPKDEWRKQEKEPDVVGKALIYFNHQLIEEEPLFYKQIKVKEDKSFFEHFRNLFHIHMGGDLDD